MYFLIFGPWADNYYIDRKNILNLGIFAYIFRKNKEGHTKMTIDIILNIKVLFSFVFSRLLIENAKRL